MLHLMFILIFSVSYLITGLSSPSKAMEFESETEVTGRYPPVPLTPFAEEDFPELNLDYLLQANVLDDKVNQENEIKKNQQTAQPNKKRKREEDDTQPHLQKKRKSPKKITEADKQKMVKLRKQGRSRREISTQMDCTTSTVLNCLKKESPSLIQAPCKKITEGDKQKILDLTQQGCSRKEIAAEIGCCVGTVRRVLKKEDPSLIKKRKDSKQITETDKQQMINLKQQGFSCKEIGEKMDRREDTVRYYLKKEDPSLIRNYLKNDPSLIKERKFSHRKITEDGIQKMVTLRKQGITYGEIAKEMGCSSTSVQNYLKLSPREMNQEEIEALKQPLVNLDFSIERRYLQEHHTVCMGVYK